MYCRIVFNFILIKVCYTLCFILRFITIEFISVQILFLLLYISYLLYPFFSKILLNILDESEYQKKFTKAYRATHRNNIFYMQNFIFEFYKSKSRVQLWLFENNEIRYEAQIIGFDEYMNMVLEDCEEVNIKNNTRNYLGRIMLKGDKHHFSERNIILYT